MTSRNESCSAPSPEALSEQQLEHIAGGWPIDWGPVQPAPTTTTTTPIRSSNPVGKWIEIYS